MAYKGYRRRRYRSGYRDRGLDRALEHIREATELSHQLGGTDVDVKEYFFSLPRAELQALLQQYGLKFGEKARSYAERTFTEWKSGRVKMSGLVAGRLFSLLPPSMPMADKYRLTERLWRHVGPRSHMYFVFGVDASVEELISKVRGHLDAVVEGYSVPDSLSRRFEWLSEGDVKVSQELLSYLQGREKDLVQESLKTNLPILLNHVQGDEERFLSRAVQTVQIGNHKIEVVLDREAQGVVMETPSAYHERTKPSVTASNADSGCLPLALGIGLVLLLLWAFA